MYITQFTTLRVRYLLSLDMALDMMFVVFIWATRLCFSLTCKHIKWIGKFFESIFVKLRPFTSEKSPVLGLANISSELFKRLQDKLARTLLEIIPLNHHLVIYLCVFISLFAVITVITTSAIYNFVSKGNQYSDSLIISDLSVRP